MGKKHILYIIGGPSRAGKSSVMVKIGEKHGGLAVFNPQALCRPIVKNLFAKDVPADTATLSFEGTTSFDPPSLRKTRPFKIDMSLAESIAPSLPKEVLIGMPTDHIRGIIRAIFAEERGLSEIGFEGGTSFISAKGEASKQPITIPIQGEDPVAWRALIGLLADYDRQNKHDALIEGVAINPENITALELPNFEKRIAFVGLNDEAYAKPLLEYLQKEGEAKKDHLFAEMRNSGKSDEEFIAANRCGGW